VTDNIAARALMTKARQALRSAHRLIDLADYDGDSVEMGDAVNMVADGEVFIAAIEQFMA